MHSAEVSFRGDRRGHQDERVLGHGVNRFHVAPVVEDGTLFSAKLAQSWRIVRASCCWLR